MSELGVCYLYNTWWLGRGGRYGTAFGPRPHVSVASAAFVDSRYHATRKNRIWVRSLYEAGCQRILLSFCLSLLVPSLPG